MNENFGSLIIDLQGTTLQPEERDLLNHPLVGGLILFSRNYESPEQIKALVHGVRKSLAKPFLIMVDQEGGRVQRFRQGFTRLPPAGLYGQIYDDNPRLGLQLAETGGWVMASELVACGIDLSLAPILDLNKGISSVIGDRAFHRESAVVIQLAGAYIRGMKAAGMAATGKHFPGHGSVAPDSHQELPIDARPYEALEKEDLLPFMHFIKEKIPAFMTAHIQFPALDQQPVSFSQSWLKTILREKLHYEGVIMSDDLDMKGAAGAGTYADRFCLAREAGCDLILLCNNRAAAIQVLDQVNAKDHLLEDDRYFQLCARFPTEQAKPVENKIWLERRDFLLEHCETL